MGLDFTWLGLEKSDPSSPGDLEKPDPSTNPGKCLQKGAHIYLAIKIILN